MISMSPVQEVIALYDALSAAGQMPPLCWGQATIGMTVKIDDHGGVRTAMPLGNDCSMVVPIPFVSRSSGLAPTFGTDNAKYLVGEAWEAWREHHLAFSDKAAFPPAFVHFLKNGKTTFVPTKEPKIIRLSGSDLSGTFVIELPDGTYLHEHASVKSFWQPDNIIDWENHGRLSQGRDPIRTVEGYSSVDGKWGKLVEFHAAIGMVVPEAQGSAKLGAVNTSGGGYSSYGMDGGFTSPMTIDQTFKLASTIRFLGNRDKAAGDRTSCRPIVARGRKISIMSDRMKAVKALVLGWGEPTAVSWMNEEFAKDDDSMRKAIDVIDGIMCGKAEVPGVTQDDRVCFMAMSAPTKGRIAIDEFWSGDAPTVAVKMAKWHAASMTTDPDMTRQVQTRYQFVKSLGIGHDKALNESEAHVVRGLFQSAIEGEQMPVDIAYHVRRACQRVLATGDAFVHGRSSLYSPLRTLRGCMARAGVGFNEGGYEMIDKTAAYQLGVLLIAFDDAVRSDEWRRTRKWSRSSVNGLHSNTKSILPTCLAKPSAAVATMRHKHMQYYARYWPQDAVNINDECFSALPATPLSQQQRDEFFAGTAHGLELRSRKIAAIKAAKTQREARE